MNAKKAEEQWLTNPGEVNQYLQNLNHPMVEVLEALRQVILNTDAEIGEHIKWNAPSFFYTGPIAPFNPKEYKRYIIVSNFFRKDCIRLVFPSGSKINDTSGLLEGDYADGRRLAHFYSLDDVRTKSESLRWALKTWLSQVEKP